MRRLAICLYGLGLVLAAWLCLVYFGANKHLPFTVSLNNAAWSFGPMFLLMAGVLTAQGRSDKIIWSLPLIIIAAAVTLLFSLVRHGFPEEASIWSVAHIAVVVASGAFLIRHIARSFHERSAL